MSDAPSLIDRLSRAGFVNASGEAAALIAAADDDDERLDALLERRLTGEPLAWITGTIRFCGLDVHVDADVYVPRRQSELLALRAVARLPAPGIAIDLCTGTGAVAAVLLHRHPRARIVATDIDERAVGCARRNGVEAYRGDLFDPLPSELRGAADVVVGVVPYVPTPALPLLQRDTLTFESARSYDGGEDGATILRRVVVESPEVLRRGGALLLELGDDQADALEVDLAGAGFVDVEVWHDDDGDVRGIEATLG